MPELVDSDLLKGGRLIAGDDEKKIRSKARPHNLVLQIVLERAFELNNKEPVVMAIGPGRQTDPEPPQAVFLVRAFLTGLCAELEERGVRILCLNWESPEQLTEILGLPIKRAVTKGLNGSATPLIRAPYVMCAGTALAAIKTYQQLQAHAR